MGSKTVSPDLTEANQTQPNRLVATSSPPNLVFSRTPTSHPEASNPIGATHLPGRTNDKILGEHESAIENRSVKEALDNPRFVIKAVNVVISQEEKNVFLSSPPLKCRDNVEVGYLVVTM